MITQLAAYLSGAAILYHIASIAMSWYRLRHFRGPPLASLSYIWLFKTNASGKAHEIHMATRDKYQSSLIRVGPNDLTTDDPAIIQRMSSARSTYSRGEGWKSSVIDVKQPPMMGLLDTAMHDDIKARVSFGYSGKEVPSLESDIWEQVESMKQLIRTSYLSTGSVTKPLDIARIIQFFALDVVSKLAWGDAFGFLLTNTDINGFVKAFTAFIPMAAQIHDIPLIRNVFCSTLMDTLFGPKPTDKGGAGRILGLAQEAVDRRLTKEEDKTQDMLASFLRHGLSPGQAVAELTIQIMAGSDTTSNALRSIFLYIAATPTAYAKLQQEIDDAIATDRISSPVKLAEARSLPYLQATIYEAIRIRPPLVLMAWKKVPPQGDTIDGQFVPGGTNIGQNTWSMMRRIDIFGRDVNLFRPERWLEAEPIRRAEMTRTVELLFGYGRWTCAGKHVAFIELNMVVVELLRDFDFQLINPVKPLKEEMYMLFLVWDMWMRVAQRH